MQQKRTRKREARRHGGEKGTISVYFQGLTSLSSQEYQTFSTRNHSTLLPNIKAKICKIYMKYTMALKKMGQYE